MIIEAKDGKIVSGKQQFLDMLLKGGKFVVEKYIRKRTLDQNAYMRGLFSKIAEDALETHDYIKYFFQKKYLTAYSNKKKIEYIRGTSSLNTIEFNEFVEKVLDFMALQGHVYPTPEEYKQGIRFTD